MPLRREAQASPAAPREKVRALSRVVSQRGRLLSKDLTAAGLFLSMQTDQRKNLNIFYGHFSLRTFQVQGFFLCAAALGAQRM